MNKVAILFVFLTLFYTNAMAIDISNTSPEELDNYRRLIELENKLESMKERNRQKLFVG